MRRIIVSSALILLFIIVGTVIAILYAQGERLDLQNGKLLKGTGILALSSTPEGARVYIDDELRTATNNTINLSPGEYTVKIEKEGYYPWVKKISIKERVVSQATARLFPSTPKLEPITNTGTQHTVVDETGTLIAYTVASSSAEKNGVYLLDMSARPILPIGGLSTQLANDTTALFSQSEITFSPDGDEVMASISGTLGYSNYLLSTKSFNQNPLDITETLATTQLEWGRLETMKRQRTISGLQQPLRPIANQYFSKMIIAPEEDKILYTASESGTLSIVINPRLPGANSTPETREITAGNVYVYDIKEDRNYLIYDTQNGDKKAPRFVWHPGSDHLIYIEDNRISIMEYDAQNKTTVYGGAFDPEFVSVWPDGSNLVILTNHNIPSRPKNLYRLSLR